MKFGINYYVLHDNSLKIFTFAYPSLRERLIKEDIIDDETAKTKETDSDSELSPMRKQANSKPIPTSWDEPEEPVFDVDDEASWDALRATQAIKMKAKTAYGTKFHDGVDYSDTSELIDGKTKGND